MRNSIRQKIKQITKRVVPIVREAIAEIASTLFEGLITFLSDEFSYLV